MVGVISDDPDGIKLFEAQLRENVNHMYDGHGGMSDQDVWRMIHGTILMARSRALNSAKAMDAIMRVCRDYMED